MKRCFPYMVFILAFACKGVDSCCQNLSTMGTDFWFSFMEGRIEASMSVTVTGVRACSGVLTNPNTGWSHSFSVPAGGSVTITIDTANSYNTVSNSIKNKGLHLTATDTVSVYVSNFLATSFDATFVLPTSVLRDKYLIQTFATWKPGNPSEILILATTDNTVVDIYPEASTVNRPSLSPFSVTLNAGQTYLMQCNGNGDYSGTRIEAQDCKPIAVFSGHLCAHIPENLGTYCDHLFEQSVPTTYWGRRFVATKTMNHNGDYVKVTSQRDNCRVMVDGAEAAMLDAGESYHFVIRNTQVCSFIETSQPATVYEYMVSKNYGGPDGDPSMVLLAPIEQQLRDVVFVNYSYTGQLSQYHYVNIVTLTSETGNIRLDGTSIANQFHPVGGNSDYSYARIQTTAGMHRLSSLGENGFVAHAYGLGANESYGYAVGFSARPLDKTLVVNGIEVMNGGNYHICAGDDVKVYIKHNDSIDIGDWNINGSLATIRDTLKWTFNDAGLYDVSVNFDYLDDCQSRIDTLFFNVVVSSNESTTFDTMSCDGSFEWNGHTFDAQGTYVDTLATAKGCDSIVTMNLALFDVTYGFVDTVDCDSVVFNDSVFHGNSLVVADTTIGANGCDSITKMQIIVHRSKSTELNVSINEGDSLLWIDGQYYNDPNDHPTVTLQTSEGCDSAVSLNLNVIAAPPRDSSEIWIPNVFTPDNESNRLFRVYGIDLIEVHVYIFNRWGNIAADFDGLTECWNGTHNGQPCKQDSYTYLVEYKIKAMPSVKKIKKGTVTLLR